jgi:large repetitive protein
VPLASDASGNGTQDYHQVAGRATAVVIDPADSTGNTVYIGGAQSGIWKSTNATNAVANDVAWTPITDNQATLSIGAIAIQPGNRDPAKSLILAATGEANNSGDSYFGLGILRSPDAGNTWTLVSTANSGALSFTGLGGTRMAFSNANGQTSTAVAAMAASSEGLVDGAITTATRRGLYTSLDAGQSWTYDALSDPGGAADPTSATSVVYNEGAGKFFAAIRYHGIYSSPDGVTWSRLANQPGGAVLSAVACPPQSVSNNYACPIYRGEITVVPGLNDSTDTILSIRLSVYNVQSNQDVWNKTIFLAVATASGYGTP